MQLSSKNVLPYVYTVATPYKKLMDPDFLPLNFIKGTISMQASSSPLPT